MTIKEQHHLEALSKKHRELDETISELQSKENFDDLELLRLKQDRLKIKDEIASFQRHLESAVKE